MGLLLAVLACRQTFGQDRILPSDTSFLLVFNARAALQSKPLREMVVPWTHAIQGKSHYLGQLAEILGIDPLRDLWTISLATGVARDRDRMILFLRGGWSQEALARRLKEKSSQKGTGLGRANQDNAKPVYRWSPSGGKEGPVFVAVTEDGGIVTSLSREYVDQALRSGPKSNLSNRHFQELVAALDTKALALAAVSGESIDWSLVPEGTARDTFKSSRGISGHLTLNRVETELNLELTLESPDAATAATNRQALEDLTGQSMGYFAMLASQQPRYKVVQTALKSTRNEAKGNLVRITATVPMNEVRDFLNPGPGLQGKQD